MALPPENLTDMGLPPELGEEMGPPGLPGLPGPSGLPGMPASPAEEPVAPAFPDPEAIDISEEDQEKFIRYAREKYEQNVISRDNWKNRHQVYDQMFRGEVEQFSNRTGPWENSSRLHIQMPYWLVDSINARMVHTMFSQNPLVQGVWYEDDDKDVAKVAAHLVEWHLQRMKARELWARASKIRLIHGVSVSLLSYVHDMYTYRAIPDAEPVPQFNDDGTPMISDDDGLPVMGSPEAEVVEGDYYRGPVLYPLEWDDTIIPIGCMNLQPRRASNPGGADWVITRQWEELNLMRRKANADNSPYPHMYDDDRDDQWWIDNAADQTRSVVDRGDQNAQRVRQQDMMEGVNRVQAVSRRSDERSNPEFEVFTYWGPWEHPDTGNEEEMVVFFTKTPDVFLGAFLLSDIVWTGDRPLIEQHYQTVSNRFYSMGVCEICEHLSEELDTLHNLRIDVGQATNMPFYFVRAGSSINPSEIKLKPLELVPVDNPNEIVAPQTQGVTSFYHQEEMLLLTIVERVMGVTDLFMGVSPTTGAAARHATGFLGTQQEAEARMSEPLNQDANAFGFMAKLIYNLDMQYGPTHRTFRLEGKTTAVAAKGLSRDDLWFRGQYDFRLGANVGMYSQLFRHQRAQTAAQYLMQSPLVMNDMGRHWAVTNEILASLGYSQGEIETFIGPQDAVSQGTPKPQDEENGQMAQYLFGYNVPAPVHPSDNDQEHMADVDTWLGSEEYNDLGRPNELAYEQHKLAHQNAIVQKQQQAQMMQQQAMGAGQPGSAPGVQGGANPQQRAAGQVANVPAGPAAGFANIYQSQTAAAGGGNGMVAPPTQGM